jgi:uncharacterized protein (DUF58 family)
VLTARGWWVLLVGLAVSAVGLVAAGSVPPLVATLGLSVVGWLLVGWATFAWQVRDAAGRLNFDRQLLVGDRPVPAVWAGLPVTVRVTVRHTGSARLPFVWLEDRPPTDLSPAPAAADGFDLRPDEPAVIEYPIRPAAPGVLRFEGVRVRVADPCGFFYLRAFLRQPVEVPVLPPLTDDEGKHRGTKKFNTLPPPGVHRLQRPGSGGDLLDLRDYRPGDPPKMIAWKPSARRDRLITKEFESDVPVRCVLFVDASNGARVGPPGKAPVVRLATVAAGVAQAAAANRDIVGLTVFTESVTAVISPARTRVHTTRLLIALGQTAAGLPDPGQTDPELLVRYADPVARDLYPDLMTADVNGRPFGMYWRAVSDTRLLWLVLGLYALPVALFFYPPLLNGLARFAADVAPTGRGWIVLLILLMLPWQLATLIWLVHGVMGFLPSRRKRIGRRKQLAALFAGLDGAGPAAVERWLRDDAAFADRAARFLQDHRVRLPLVLYDPAGRYRFRSTLKVSVLATALVRAVGLARDNELYVILADLAELPDQLAPLVSAVKLARARHHQVLVLVHWPADIPADPAGEWTGGRVKLADMLRSVLVGRFHKGFAELRTTLTRAGASVVRLGADDPIPVVLDRLDRLRGVRVRR